jgi:hypothetical protein
MSRDEERLKGSSKFRSAYAKWRKLLDENNRSSREMYMESTLPEKTMQKIVSWEEMQKRYCDIKDNEQTWKDPAEHKLFLLLAVALFLRPKRADLGAVHVLSRHPSESQRKRINYMVVSQKQGVLYMNVFKTSKFYGTIEEPLPDPFFKILNDSLTAFPRKFLFTDTRGEPFTNRTYSTFVRRSFLQMFGRPMGVSALRHVYVRQRLDFNKMTHRQLKHEARLMCHSIGQQLLVYKYINEQKHPQKFSEEPVTCPTASTRRTRRSLLPKKAKSDVSTSVAAS